MSERVLPARVRVRRMLRKLGDLARYDPWERGRHRVNRRGELVVAQVSPPVRVLCALMAISVGWVAGFIALSRGELLLVSLLIWAVALLFGGIAVTGIPTMVVDPEASDRFRALADPTRPLPEPPPPADGSGPV